jgi:diguanylate cyclase (GGDEF)-like protein/PAS domain S-box-containing protein
MPGVPTSSGNNPTLISLLIVEDEPRYLESTRLLVSQYVHSIDSAVTGAQAFALLARRGYDLALLDLRLPDASGHDIMAYIRQHHPDCRVIVMSGDSQIESAIQSLRLGAYDYLRKPYEPDELIKTVRNAVVKLQLERDNARMLHQLEQSEQWHRLLVNTSPDVIYTLDARGAFTYVNDSIERTLGYAPAELIGKDYLVLVPPGEVDNARHRINERRTGERATRNYEIQLKRKEDLLSSLSEHTSSDHVVVELSSMGMYRALDPDHKEFLGTYGVARDISERKQAEATIAFQAYHDLLTGLPNRALFKDRLGQAIVHAKRHGQTLATLFLDMDRFKVVNDTLGHLVGDGLLQAVAQRLRGSLREGDTLSRIGGDEFMLLLPHIRTRDNAAYIADKILASLKQPFHIEGHEIFVGISIGIAVFPDDGDTIESLVKHADIAMYHAKDSGRNDYKFFTHDLQKSFTGRLAVENEMRHALDKQQFEVYYQPQVSIPDQRIRGMEALIRWNHPSRGIVPPNEFIPIAEECGLITPINEWVLAAACRQATLWRASELPAVTMAVNLSAGRSSIPSSWTSSPTACGKTAWAARAGNRDHREHPDARHGRQHREAAQAGGTGGGDLHRRFRHRLLLPVLSEEAAHPHPQDRPQLHPRPERPHEQRQHHRGRHRRHGQGPESQPGGRGRGDPGPARLPALARLRRLSGLSVQSSRDRRQGHRNPVPAKGLTKD